jgi:hypothetical protein
MKNIDMFLIRNILIGLEIVLGLFAIIFYYKYRNSFLKYFVILIWYAIINEFIGQYYSANIDRNNTVIYNIYKIVEFSFYLLLYKNIIKNINYKNTISVFLILYYISIIINCFYESFIYDYFIKNYILGAAFIIVSIVFYFIETLNSNKIMSIDKSLYFWFSVALLINYLPNIPFKIVTKYYVNSPTIPYIYLTTYILAFISFSILIYGFLCSKIIPKH